MTEKRKRYWTLLLIISLIFSLLALQLARWQIWHGPDLRARALGQQGQELQVKLNRGGIYDRNMVSLTGSEWQMALGVFPTLVEDKDTTARELAAYLALDLELLLARLNLEKPFLLPVTQEGPDLALFQAGALPGVYPVQQEQRYGSHALARHLVGYLEKRGYRGIAGLERYYDNYLAKGQGLTLVAWVDANGQLIPGLGIQQRPQGQGDKGDLILTLDARIQGIVEEAMDRHQVAGSVVVAHVMTGDILAMASRPNFDQAQFDHYLEFTDGCLLNRALLGYPPGSLFKIIVAGAALEEGITDLTGEFLCSGQIEVGDRFYRCHQHQDGHGVITLAEAFAQSCNPVFISLAQDLGEEKLLTYARRFGLGEKVLNLPEETEGYLPSQLPFPGDLANLSLGQGSLLATPLQMLQIIQAAANDGLLLPLQLVKKGPGHSRDNLQEELVVWSEQTAEEMRILFQETMLSGTGQEGAPAWWTSGGKTGTAETGRYAEGRAITHAWFGGFVPLESPLLALVVLVEDGGSGGKVAAPLFREITEEVLYQIPVTELQGLQ